MTEEADVEYSFNTQEKRILKRILPNAKKRKNLSRTFLERLSGNDMQIFASWVPKYGKA